MVGKFNLAALKKKKIKQKQRISDIRMSPFFSRKIMH